jgi:hypothetical protein
MVGRPPQSPFLLARAGDHRAGSIAGEIVRRLKAAEDDGHLVHAHKRTGMQFVSVKTWPNLIAARQALAIGFSKIEWAEMDEPPPVI